MKYPNFKEEKKLWKKGYKFVIGVDEAGRGCLGGPVVAAAVAVLQFSDEKIQAKTFLKKHNLSGIKDSKKLSPKKREEFYKNLTRNSAIEWGIGKVSEKVIDKINILEATKLAMKKAVKNLKNKLFKRKFNKINKKENNIFYSELCDCECEFLDKNSFLIIDGNFKLNLPVGQKTIIKADEKVFSCVSASIIAKATRDRIMIKYDKKYPQYGFEHHKGYGTKLHLKALEKYGPCPIHRKTFNPVNLIAKIHQVADS